MQAPFFFLNQKVAGAFTALLFCSSMGLVQATTTVVPGLSDPVDMAAGGEYYSANCAVCHAADGNSSIAENPKLAGQHPVYLVKQLHEFKSGERNNAVMQAFVAPMSEADMANVAAWLWQQTPKPGFAKNSDTLALAEKMYRGGATDRQIPACAGCHSPNGAGVPARFPRLAGQQAVYTVNQMKAFRDGTRANSLPMADIAAKMSDPEIQAIADYIAGLR